MKNVFLTAAGVCCCLLATAIHASAVLPGASCHAIGQNQTGLDYDTHGRVSNVSTSPISVVCPVVRQHLNEGWQDIRVTVANRNSSQNIRCDAVSAQTDGLGWALTKSSAAFSPEPYQSEVIAFGRPSDQRIFGSYYLVCTLPPLENGRASTVMSYTIIESCHTTNYPLNYISTEQNPRFVTITDCN